MRRKWPNSVVPDWLDILIALGICALFAVAWVAVMAALGRL